MVESEIHANGFLRYILEQAERLMISKSLLGLIVMRFNEGRLEHEGGSEDWDRPGYNLKEQITHEVADAITYALREQFQHGEDIDLEHAIQLFSVGYERIVGEE